MKSKDIVKAIRKQLIVEDLDVAKRLFEETNLDQQVTDPYFRKAIPFVKDLDRKEKAILYAIIKQSKIDALAGMFAILDDVSDLEGQQEEFRLFYGDKEIQGDLLDLFLGMDS